MREIKFRAWLKKEKIMVLIEPIEIIHFLKKYRFDDGLIDDGCYFLKEEYFLMQFTGLKDLHGKEIYEGDILKIPSGYFGDSFYKESLGIIEYLEDGFYPRNPYDKDGTTWQDFNWGRTEIIGNIYENPELIK